jgi:glyoxylase-like metal-dependent hydrolase (beta-lactamase superfamily II)
MSSVANIFLMFYNKQEIEEDLIKPTICKPAEEVFEDRLDFNWNDHKINLLAVHGHSSDGLIAILDDKYMFSGDSLLSIPTVTRFPNGSTRKFWEEDIPLLKSLKQELVVYPGHGMPGRIVDMLTRNKLPKKYNK